MSAESNRRHSRSKVKLDLVDTSDRDVMEYMEVVLRGKRDPVWWVNNVLSMELYPTQEEIMRKFYRSRYDPTLDQYKKLILVAGMRSGKTALASIMGCYEYWDVLTMTNPKPFEYYKLLRNQKLFIMVVATSEKQAEDGVFSNIQSMIEGAPWFHTWSDTVIRGDSIESFKQRIKLQTMSSWANTGVGRTSKCVIFDELANFEQTSGKRGAWEVWNRIRKSADTIGPDGHVIGISSPMYPTDIIMTLYRDGLEEKNTLALMKPTWEMNPNFTEAELREEHKHNLAAFYRDYACQPQAAGGVQFPEGVKLVKMENVLKELLKKKEKFSAQTNVMRVLAIDPAVKNDSFGMACAYRSWNGNPVVDGAIKFQREDGQSIISPSMIREYIDLAIRKLNVNAFVFDAWIFPDLVEYVNHKFGIEATKHIVRKEDYDLWRSLQENDEVTVVYDPDLKREAERLQVINEKNPRVDHDMHGSKDMADCVANCIWYVMTHSLVNMNPGFVCVKVF